MSRVRKGPVRLAADRRPRTGLLITSREAIVGGWRSAGGPRSVVAGHVVLNAPDAMEDAGAGRAADAAERVPPGTHLEGHAPSWPGMWF